MEKTKRKKYRYITDEDGRKKEIILPIKDFREMIEDIQDLSIAAERRDEPTISHSELLSLLKENEKI
jgi:hypothetical protein